MRWQSNMEANSLTSSSKVEAKCKLPFSYGCNSKSTTISLFNFCKGLLTILWCYIFSVFNFLQVHFQAHNDAIIQLVRFTSCKLIWLWGHACQSKTEAAHCMKKGENFSLNYLDLIDRPALHDGRDRQQLQAKIFYFAIVGQRSPESNKDHTNPLFRGQGTA